MLYGNNQKNSLIHYISNHKITVLARQTINNLGQIIIETFWADSTGNGGGAGMVLFLSALDAEIIRQIKNKNLKANETKWLRYDLSQIDLLQYIEQQGGTIILNILIAFGATQSNSLVCPSIDEICPLMTLFPYIFEIPKGSFPKNQHCTFRFSDETFERIGNYWKGITTEDYEILFDEINHKNDKELAELANQAIQKIKIQPIDQIKRGWLNDQHTIYALSSQKWVYKTNIDEESKIYS